jgi:hypothetical protein
MNGKHKSDFRQDFGQDNPAKKIDHSLQRAIRRLSSQANSRAKRVSEFLISKCVCNINGTRSSTDGSDTGAGKTYAAVGVARELGMKDCWWYVQRRLYHRGKKSYQTLWNGKQSLYSTMSL